MDNPSNDSNDSSRDPRAGASADDGVVIESRCAAIIPNFDFRVDVCAASAQGRGRRRNEDAVLCNTRIALFGVADGMGGHPAGDVAAKLALAASEEHLKGKRARRVIERYAREPNLERRRTVFALLEDAISAANTRVIEEGERHEETKGMGTTLDLMLLIRDRAFIAHVGDSRSYLVRPTTTVQLTHDHALYDSLRTSGKRSDARRFARSPLSNSVGHRRNITVDTLFVDLNQGERLVLCTDGVFNALEGETAFGRACRNADTESACRGLIAAAQHHESLDDASVVAITMQERFVQRSGDDGPRARDIEIVSTSPLLTGLEPADVLATLAAAVEVELAPDEEVPCAVASDRVAYIVLDGIIELGAGRLLGASGLLMAESLLDVPLRGKLPTVRERARLLRIRHDDYNEICAHDPHLAANLYKRIAKHLATAGNYTGR